ncbi:MAG: hypothetical protein ACI92I_000201 [Acidimicrobiales bacterium]|jgi:hypothetical protein
MFEVRRIREILATSQTETVEVSCPNEVTFKATHCNKQQNEQAGLENSFKKLFSKPALFIH